MIDPTPTPRAETSRRTAHVKLNMTFFGVHVYLWSYIKLKVELSPCPAHLTLAVIHKVHIYEEINTKTQVLIIPAEVYSILIEQLFIYGACSQRRRKDEMCVCVCQCVLWWRGTNNFFLEWCMKICVFFFFIKVQKERERLMRCMVVIYFKDW
jgi:hypothetical protein